MNSSGTKRASSPPDDGEAPDPPKERGRPRKYPRPSKGGARRRPAAKDHPPKPDAAPAPAAIRPAAAAPSYERSSAAAATRELVETRLVAVHPLIRQYQEATSQAREQQERQQQGLWERSGGGGSGGVMGPDRRARPGPEKPGPAAAVVDVDGGTWTLEAAASTASVYITVFSYGTMEFEACRARVDGALDRSTASADFLRRKNIGVLPALPAPPEPHTLPGEMKMIAVKTSPGAAMMHVNVRVGNVPNGLDVVIAGADARRLGLSRGGGCVCHLLDIDPDDIGPDPGPTSLTASDYTNADAYRSMRIGYRGLLDDGAQTAVNQAQVQGFNNSGNSNSRTTFHVPVISGTNDMQQSDLPDGVTAGLVPQAAFVPGPYLDASGSDFDAATLLQQQLQPENPGTGGDDDGCNLLRFIHWNISS